MQEVEISLTQIDEARKKAAAMGTLNNSITGGGGNLIGFVGEVIAADLLKAEWANTYDYDIILRNGETADVKTVGTTVTPDSSYNCTVSNYNIKQDCDYYCFMRVTRDLTKGWFLGIVDKSVFLKEATFKKKGDVEDNNFVVRSDCYTLPISYIEKYYEDNIKDKIKRKRQAKRKQLASSPTSI